MGRQKRVAIKNLGTGRCLSIENLLLLMMLMPLFFYANECDLRKESELELHCESLIELEFEICTLMYKG